MNLKLNISFIAADSPRLRSYLYFLNKSNYFIEKIFLLKKNSISEKFKFLNNSYFDNTQQSFDNFLLKNKKKIVKINSNSANNPNLLKKLSKTKSKYVVFCSNPGDILKAGFFNINKKIIHVHPGKLPKFRGSTPYYYQILKNKDITFTSLFMGLELDKGEPILFETQKLEEIKKENLTFFDEVYDPYLRGKILAKTLNLIVKNKVRRKFFQKIKKGSKAYFIIHPVLKFLSINRKV
jgi:methionyl-tRNA formyltransferase